MIKIIQNKHNALAKTHLPSPPSCIGEMLQLTAQVMGKELTEEEVELWASLTSHCDNVGIEWAFRCHLRESQFFPKPVEILSRISEYKQRSLDMADLEKQESEAAKETEYLAKGGRYVGIDEIREKLLKLCKIPIPKFKQIVITPERREELRKQAEKLKSKSS